jgi:hypothetical protein
MKYLLQPLLYAIVFITQIIWFFNYKRAKIETSDWVYDNSWGTLLIIIAGLLMIIIALLSIVIIGIEFFKHS